MFLRRRQSTSIVRCKLLGAADQRIEQPWRARSVRFAQYADSGFAGVRPILVAAAGSRAGGARRIGAPPIGVLETPCEITRDGRVW